MMTFPRKIKRRLGCRGYTSLDERARLMLGQLNWRRISFANSRSSGYRVRTLLGKDRLFGTDSARQFQPLQLRTIQFTGRKPAHSTALHAPNSIIFDVDVQHLQCPSSHP